jgi:curved DNA-binding protein CbpA
MTTTLQPDPYDALGVAKDADIAAIRSSYRKLVLKHHPDRIQDPALKEKGKDAFQKIQQAYELLSDESKRSRYDDEVKLAALRREAVMRDHGPPTRSQTYPMRPAQSRNSSSREYSAEDNIIYETRQPRYEDHVSSRDRYDEPQRNTSRKYDDYGRSTSSKKSADKERPSAKTSWTKAANVVTAGIRVKKEAERARSSKSQEQKDKDRRKDRMDKEDRTRHAYQRPTVVDDIDSDSDTATHVTSSTIKPQRSTPRHTPQSSTSRSSAPPSRHHTDSEDSDYSKWETHHDKSVDYIRRAAATAGKRPNLERNGSSSFWTASHTHHRSGSEGERRPGSSRGRDYDSPPSRPGLYAQSSAPGNLKSRVEEASPKESRRSGPSSPRDRDRDYETSRREAPSLARSQTMPVPRSTSKKDAAPSKSSKLKQTETHDSGYGSSSSPQTPDLRESSPVRRSAKQSSTRYQIVTPADSDDDRGTTIHRISDEERDRRRRKYPSPERSDRERSDRDSRREKPARPRVDTSAHGRSRSSREPISPVEPPRMRRHESARYDRESPRESPSSRSQNSSREQLYDDRESRSYRTQGGEKTSLRPSATAARHEAFSRYEEQQPRSRDYVPSSRFHSDARGGSRRPSTASVF